MISRVLSSSLLFSLLLSAPTQAELYVTTTNTTLPQPPSVPQIQPKTPPQATLSQPLSRLGEQVLESICEGNLEVQKGLAMMPDLSEAHIRQSCPQQLQIQTAWK